MSPPNPREKMGAIQPTYRRSNRRGGHRIQERSQARACPDHEPEPGRVAEMQLPQQTQRQVAGHINPMFSARGADGYETLSEVCGRTFSCS